MAKRKKAEAVSEYQVVCTWRENGQDETHLSPQYAGPLEARGWVDQHRFADHGAGTNWSMDLMFYPVDAKPYVVDRWVPLGIAPDPGRWQGQAEGGSDVMTAEGRVVGRLQVDRLREALGAVEGPAKVNWRAQGGHRRESPEVPMSPSPRSLDFDLAPCSHVATAYGPHGEPICQREECRARA